MERLTSNKPVSEMNMIELAYNSCYVKDGLAKYRDYERDIDILELARHLFKAHADGNDDFIDDEDFEDYMADSLQYSLDDIEGLIAVFYRNLWAMADLRERLEYYEDLEEQGELLKLPCAVGDMTYWAHKLYGRVMDAIVKRIEIDSDGFWIITSLGTHSFDDFGKTVFLTRAEAEEALREMNGTEG